MKPAMASSDSCPDSATSSVFCRGRKLVGGKALIFMIWFFIDETLRRHTKSFLVLLVSSGYIFLKKAGIFPIR